MMPAIKHNSIEGVKALPYPSSAVFGKMASVRLLLARWRFTVRGVCLLQQLFVNPE